MYNSSCPPSKQNHRDLAYELALGGDLVVARTQCAARSHKVFERPQNRAVAYEQFKCTVPVLSE